MQEQLTLFAPGEGLLGQVQQQGQALALDDVSLVPRLARAVVKQQGLHSFAAVPLRIHGRNLGVMGIFSYSQAGFTPEAVALAASIAQQIALTFDNIALVKQVQEQARDVASLQERERIAGEIHDSIAQTLGYLYLQTDRLANDIVTTPLHQTQQHLFQMQEILATASTDVRQYITNFRAADPPPIRLSQSLSKEIERLTRELNLRVELAFEQVDDMIVSAHASTELVRIVGEALRNAERHGRADTARIDFRRQNGFSYLSISDNGTGFDPERPPDDGRSHFGLSVMRARAARICGELHIASQPGAGANIQICWPNTTAVAA